MMDNYVKPQIMPLTYSSGESPYVLAALIIWIPVAAVAVAVVFGGMWLWVGGQVQLAVHYHSALWAKVSVWLDHGE